MDSCSEKRTRRIREEAGSKMAGRGWGGTHQNCGSFRSYWVPVGIGLSLPRLHLSMGRVSDNLSHLPVP